MAENVADFVAGWASGAMATVATQPVDLLITRLQSGTARSFSGAVAVEQAWGASTWWRGVVPLLVVQPISNGLMFVGYGAGKHYAERNSRDALLPVFVGGCVGGAAQSLSQSPAELLKTRIQLHAPGHTHAPSARSLFEERAVLRGLTSTLWRDVLPHGVWFASYDLAKKRLQARQPGHPGDETPLPVGAQLSAGAFAATVAWLVGYPFDVIKTRCQMAGSSPTLLAAARALWAEGGVGAFYVGLTLKLARAIPMSAINFLAYERVYALVARSSAEESAR